MSESWSTGSETFPWYGPLESCHFLSFHSALITQLALSLAALSTRKIRVPETREISSLRRPDISCGGIYVAANCFTNIWDEQPVLHSLIVGVCFGFTTNISPGAWIRSHSMKGIKNLFMNIHSYAIASWNTKWGAMGKWVDDCVWVVTIILGRVKVHEWSESYEG